MRKEPPLPKRKAIKAPHEEASFPDQAIWCLLETSSVRETTPGAVCMVPFSSEDMELFKTVAACVGKTVPDFLRDFVRDSIVEFGVDKLLHMSSKVRAERKRLKVLPFRPQ